MVALDNLAALGQRPMSRLRLAFDQVNLLQFSLVGAIALTAAFLVLGTIAMNGFDANAFRLGSQTGWRFASLVFFAVLAAGPIGRMVGRFWAPAQLLEDHCPDLIWGFCASYGVYLLAVLLPNAISLSGGAFLFVLFGAAVICGMAVAAAPLRLSYGGAPLIGPAVRRAVLGTAMIYFWLCYSLMALQRISGPHRPDAFYDTCILLMVFGLLLRFADRWTQPRAAVAGPC